MTIKPTCETYPAFHDNQCRALPPTDKGWPAVAKTDFCCEHPASGQTHIRSLLDDAARAMLNLSYVWQDFHG